jgi:hypothetical protein
LAAIFSDTVVVHPDKKRGRVMTKRFVLAVLAVFVAWSVLDFVIHGLILPATYEATAALWRPREEMRMGLMSVVVLISSIAFVAIYAWLVGEKTSKNGLLYGLLFGIAVGVGVGYGSYAVMPIPYRLALTWFLGSVVEGAAAGLLVGAIVKK